MGWTYGQKNVNLLLLTCTLLKFMVRAVKGSVRALYPPGSLLSLSVVYGSMESSASELQLTGLRSSPAAAIDRPPTSVTQSLHGKIKVLRDHLDCWLNNNKSSSPLSWHIYTIYSWKVAVYIKITAETDVYLWWRRISRHSIAIQNTVAPAGMTRPVVDTSLNSFSPL